jgi:hypothetical protein
VPPGLTAARTAASVATAAALVALVVPLVIATVAVTPALVLCPFLTAAHRRLAVQLLAGLRQWTCTLAGVLKREDTGREPD